MGTENNEKTLKAKELKEKLDKDRIDNSEKKDGVALVNVLSQEEFMKKHIPNSINIPKGQEAQFEQRFDKDKKIVVYCASTDCNASDAVLERLEGMGFSNVKDFVAGTEGWKQAGYTLEGANT